MQILWNLQRDVLQYMGHRLEPRNEPMRRSKVLFNGSTGGLMYGGHHDGTHEYTAEVQHAAHSLSGLGQVSVRAAHDPSCPISSKGSHVFHIASTKTVSTERELQRTAS